MMRAKTQGQGSDEEEEPTEEALLEAELIRLQQGYRVIQNDYKAYREESKRIIIRQNALMDQLEGERTELDTILIKMETSQNKAKDEANTCRLTELSRTEKQHQQLMTEERTNITRLDSQIRDVERDIAKQRKKMGGLHSSSHKHNAIQKQKAVLENRLDKAMTHFNKQLAINTRLRSEIDHFCRERTVFESLHKRLSKELEQCKREITEVIGVSTQAFEQRDEAKSKAAALSDRREKEEAQHALEMKDLLRTIRHDDKIKKFMNTKANDRAEYRAEEAAKKKKDDIGLDADQAVIQTYEEAFQKILEVTGETDTDVIVENFIKAEEQNFALFNYVNELNSEVEVLQEQVRRVQGDIARFKDEQGEADSSRGCLLKELEEKYMQAQGESDKAETRLREINKTLDQLLSGVDGMFQSLHCDPRPIHEMLGGDSGISTGNVMMYLGQIEHKTTDHLNAQQFMKLKQAQIEGGSLPKTDAAAPRNAILPAFNIGAPLTREDAGLEPDMDDDDVRPLTQVELRDLIGRPLDRRAAAAAAAQGTTPGQSSATQPPGPASRDTQTKEGKKRKGAGRRNPRHN